MSGTDLNIKCIASVHLHTVVSYDGSGIVSRHLGATHVAAFYFTHAGSGYHACIGISAVGGHLGVGKLHIMHRASRGQSAEETHITFSTVYR